MKLIVAFACVCAVMAAPYVREYEVYDLQDAPELFEQFVIDYDKNYKDEADRQEHYEAFVKNLEVINKLNAESDSAVFGITMFTDQTEEERKNRRGCVLPPPGYRSD